MSDLNETTLIMLDDNVDEIFLTRRIVRRCGIVNRFISEQNSENLLSTLDELVKLGTNKDSFLLFLDINMPRIDGFEMLKIIRDHPVYNSIPVFMLSASEDLEDKNKSKTLGSDGYIVKPFTDTQFFDVLKKHSPNKAKAFAINDCVNRFFSINSFPAFALLFNNE